MINFEKQSKLGEGTYGVVYKAIDKRNGQVVALKKIRLEQEQDGISQTSLREIAVLRELHHPNVIELKEYVCTPGKLSLVFEYMDRDLRRFLDNCRTPLNPDVIKSYAYQIIAGICYCHCHRIIHRDLKPQNILLNAQGLIKIGDFGLARVFSIPLRDYTPSVVTLWYRPPELLLGGTRYSLPLDMWSVGAILAEIVTRQPLFPGDSEFDEVQRIFSILGTPTDQEWPGVSQFPDYNAHCRTFYQRRDLATVMPGADPLLIDLISRLLIYDPAYRLSAIDALNHPYFNNLDSRVKQVCYPTEINPPMAI